MIASQFSYCVWKMHNLQIIETLKKATQQSHSLCYIMIVDSLSLSLSPSLSLSLSLSLYIYIYIYMQYVCMYTKSMYSHIMPGFTLVYCRYCEKNQIIACKLLILRRLHKNHYWKARKSWILLKYSELHWGIS